MATDNRAPLIAGRAWPAGGCLEQARSCLVASGVAETELGEQKWGLPGTLWAEAFAPGRPPLPDDGSESALAVLHILEKIAQFIPSLIQWNERLLPKVFRCRLQIRSHVELGMLLL